MISPSQLTKIMPRCDTLKWTAPLLAAMEKHEINSPSRVAAFIAQVAHESGECGAIEENLRYSVPRLRAVWPGRFATDAAALPYANNPIKLANKVYANRMGNGTMESGDGWAYRGRGLIQITGRNNYARCGKALALDLINSPELLLQPDNAAMSAAWFWKDKGLNMIADKDSEVALISITKIINGGDSGLRERRQYWQRAKTALHA